MSTVGAHGTTRVFFASGAAGRRRRPCKRNTQLVELVNNANFVNVLCALYKMARSLLRIHSVVTARYFMRRHVSRYNLLY